MPESSLISSLLLALFIPAACASDNQSSSAQSVPSLKQTLKGRFLIGAALNQQQFTERDTRGAAIIRAQFNSITPENVLKWEFVHPSPDHFNFAPGDQYVAFGEKNGMFVIGHTLIWHKQTPSWVFRGDAGKPADRDLLLKRMRDHIQTIVGHYKAKVGGWDVVNEALNEDGTLRQTPWMKIIGEDYLRKAFEFAHEADPGAELYYNDFALENEPKRKGALAMVRKLKAAGVPITGIGLQNHDSLRWPSPAELDVTIDAFAREGLKVMITELDIDVLPSIGHSESADINTGITARGELNPYTNGLPDSVQQALARRYAELFQVFLKHQGQISRVTFWGVTDGDSWLNYWPVRGRTSYPLLFDRQGNPKPAFDVVIRAIKAAQ
jgi:endo-1,4-beta-xylanase